MYYICGFTKEFIVVCVVWQVMRYHIN